MRTYAKPEQIKRWVKAVKLHQQGYKFQEVADLLGVSYQVARNIVWRGQKWLATVNHKPRRRRYAV